VRLQSGLLPENILSGIPRRKMVPWGDRRPPKTRGLRQPADCIFFVNVNLRGSGDSTNLNTHCLSTCWRLHGDDWDFCLRLCLVRLIASDCRWGMGPEESPLPTGIGGMRKAHGQESTVRGYQLLRSGSSIF
jgi:hypothetical protein